MYPKARLGVNNKFSAQVRCEKKSGFVWVPVGYRTVSYTVKPTKHRQTIFVG